MHVVLIGARGSGKTTIGRRLAARLGTEYIDLDELVLARFEQPTVQRVWAELGEAAWRDAERDQLLQLLSDRTASAQRAGRAPRDRFVIALGGGVPMIPQAQQAIRQASQRNQAVAVYLKTSVETLRRRLTANIGDRPSLTGRDPVEEIEAVLTERDPIYRDLADWIITTDARSPSAIAEEIAQRLERAGTSD